MSAATAQQPPSADHRQPVIDAFARALRRETHVLAARPDLTFQQLCNRLQFEDDPLPDAIAAHRLDGPLPPRPWLRSSVPLQESAALVATLTGHTGGINACAVSRDGSFIVSASDDRTLKVWDAATGEERATFVGHIDRVTCCAVSPDGGFVASGSRDGTLRIWDTATGQERQLLSSFRGAVMSCAISPDGSFLVSTNLYVAEPEEDGPGYIGPGAALIIKVHNFLLQGREIKIWDLPTLAERADLSGWAGSCGVSPDGTFIVSGSSGRVVGYRKYRKLWDTSEGKELAELAGRRRRRALSWAVSPDGRFIVSADYDGTLRIWDVPTKQKWRPQRARTTIAGHSAPVRSCAVAPDGGFIVSASDDHAVKIWDPDTGDERATLVGHTGAVTACVVSPDGRFIVSGGRDRTVKIWSSAGGEEGAAFHARRVNSCATSPDGRTVVSASDDGTLKTWDAVTGKERATLARHSGKVTCCEVSPDGTFAVSGSHRPQGFRGRLKIWDLASGTERATLSGPEMRVYACAVSADGSFIVSTEDDKLRVWDVPTRTNRRRQRRRAVFTGHTGNPSVPGTAVQLGSVIAGNVIKACAISPEGSFLVSGGDDRRLRIWQVPKRKKWRAQKAWAVASGHLDLITCCAVSPDGQLIVSGSWDETLRVWDSATAEELAVLRGHGDRVTCCAVSPDGRFIVSGSWDQTLRVWDGVTGEGLRVLRGHADRVTCCAVSADGRLIASGSDDQTLRIWDSESGAELATIYLIGAPTCLALSRSRPLVAAGDGAGGLYMLDAVGLEYGHVPRIRPQLWSGAGAPPVRTEEVGTGRAVAAFMRELLGRGIVGALTLLVYGGCYLGLVGYTAYVAVVEDGWSKLEALIPGIVLILITLGGALMARDLRRHF